MCGEDWVSEHVPGHTQGSQWTPWKPVVSSYVCTRNGTQVVRPGGKNLYFLSHLKDSRCSLRKGFSSAEWSRRSWLHICIYPMHLLFYSVPGGHSWNDFGLLASPFPLFGKCFSFFTYLLCFDSNVILFIIRGKLCLFHYFTCVWCWYWWYWYLGRCAYVSIDVRGQT